MLGYVQAFPHRFPNTVGTVLDSYQSIYIVIGVSFQIVETRMGGTYHIGGSHIIGGGGVCWIKKTPPWFNIKVLQ